MEPKVFFPQYTYSISVYQYTIPAVPECSHAALQQGRPPVTFPLNPLLIKIPQAVAEKSWTPNEAARC